MDFLDPHSVPVGLAIPAMTATARQVSLDGLCSVEGNPDVACSAVELAIDHVVVGCRAAVSIGDKVIFAFPEFGLLEAIVAETFKDGFVANFEPCLESKLGLYLSWLAGAPSEPVSAPADSRTQERITPVRRLTTLATADEPDNMARIIDLSRSSVSFTTSRSLDEGESVALGTRAGRVVRVFEGGAAVELDQEIAEDDFNPMVDLRKVPD